MKIIFRKNEMVLDQPIECSVLKLEFAPLISIFFDQNTLDGLIQGKYFENKMPEIKSKITIWQPSDKQEGKEWHDSMMDQLKSGYM